MQQADFIIIGGGIAGASSGYELSKSGKVILLERENHPGYHATGRSAAIYNNTYMHGDPVLRALVMGSTPFLRNPPAGFCEHDLLTPRQLLNICHRDNLKPLMDLHDALIKITDDVTWVSGAEIDELIPVLKQDYREKAILEREICDIDVHALHEGFLRGMRHQGSEIICGAPVQDISRTGGIWSVSTPSGSWTAPVIVNAAGAWVDQIAALAGVTPIGIRPLRRTAILVSPPTGLSIDHWPFVLEAGHHFYFKPDAGKILASPMDEHLSEPCDAQPEEMDVAYAAHYLEEATGIAVPRIDHSWAGLRSHVEDRHPVAGFAPDAPGFFWLAGQGGFGIKTSAAMGRITAALVAGKGLPEDLSALGLQLKDISAERLFT